MNYNFEHIIDLLVKKYGWTQIPLYKK